MFQWPPAVAFDEGIYTQLKHRLEVQFQHRAIYAAQLGPVSTEKSEEHVALSKKCMSEAKITAQYKKHPTEELKLISEFFFLLFFFFYRVFP